MDRDLRWAGARLEGVELPTGPTRVEPIVAWRSETYAGWHALTAERYMTVRWVTGALETCYRMTGILS